MRSTPSQLPKVWLLLGPKTGDNHQVIALAEALGWPYERKSIDNEPWELFTNLALGATLAGINRKKSSQLAPPWPDLVISAGRRNEPVARWIKQQSGDRCRLVHIGRPWAAPACYDLIVTTPQYFLPDSDRIFYNSLPMHLIEPEKLASAAAQLAPHLVGYPRPYTVALLGGNSGPFVFTPDKAARMGRLTNQLVAHEGGSLLVTDSRRTPVAASRAFWAQIQVPAFRYSCHPADGVKAQTTIDNPYLGFLGLGDQFVVTGESMSMIAEVETTGKPLYLFDMQDADRRWWRKLRNYHHKPLSHHLSMHLAPLRMRRDVGRIQAALIDAGKAAWLDESMQKPLTQHTASRGAASAAQIAATRVKALF